MDKENLGKLIRYYEDLPDWDRVDWTYENCAEHAKNRLGGKGVELFAWLRILPAEAAKIIYMWNASGYCQIAKFGKLSPREKRETVLGMLYGFRETESVQWPHTQ